MKNLLASTALTLALTVPAVAEIVPVPTPRPTEIVVKNDLGGNLLSRAKYVVAMFDSDINVRLEGFCASACTVWLAMLETGRICAAPDTILLFHRPYLAPEDRDEAVAAAAAAGFTKAQAEAEIARQAVEALDVMMSAFPAYLVEYLQPRMPNTSPEMFVALTADDVGVPTCLEVTS